MKKSFASLFLFLLVTVALLSQEDKSKSGIILSPDNIGFIINDFDMSDYSECIIPFTKDYVLKKKIKIMTLTSIGKSDTTYSEFSFDVNGELKKIKNYNGMNVLYQFKNYNEKLLTFTDEVDLLGDKIIYNVSYSVKENKITKYDNLCTFDNSQHSSEIKESEIGDYIIITDDVFTTRCIIYLNDSSKINDREFILKGAKEVAEKHELINSRGVIFQIYAFNKKLISEYLKFTLSDNTKIENYDEIETYTYNELRLLANIEVYKYLANEKKRTKKIEYNNDNYPISISADGGIGYNFLINISYSENLIKTVNYEYSTIDRSSIKKEINYTYTFY